MDLVHKERVASGAPSEEPVRATTWKDGVSWAAMGVACVTIGVIGWGLVGALRWQSPEHGLAAVAAGAAYLVFCRFGRLIRERTLALTPDGRLSLPQGAPGRLGAHETGYRLSDVVAVEYAAWSDWNRASTPEAAKAKEGLIEVFLMMADGSRLVVSRQWNREAASRIVAQLTGFIREARGEHGRRGV